MSRRADQPLYEVAGTVGTDILFNHDQRLLQLIARGVLTRASNLTAKVCKQLMELGLLRDGVEPVVFHKAAYNRIFIHVVYVVVAPEMAACSCSLHDVHAMRAHGLRRVRTPSVP